MYLCVNMCEGSVIVNNSQLFRREGKEKGKKRHTRSDRSWFHADKDKRKAMITDC